MSQNVVENNNNNNNELNNNYDSVAKLPPNKRYKSDPNDFYKLYLSRLDSYQKNGIDTNIFNFDFTNNQIYCKCCQSHIKDQQCRGITVHISKKKHISLLNKYQKNNPKFVFYFVFHICKEKNDTLLHFI